MYYELKQELKQELEQELKQYQFDILVYAVLAKGRDSEQRILAHLGT